MRFSQRMGITPIKKVLQINSMDNELRVAICNEFYRHFIFSEKYDSVANAAKRVMYHSIWTDFLGKELDMMPSTVERFRNTTKKWFFAAEWYEVYEFVEFVCGDSVTVTQLHEWYNVIFEKKLSGYRFVAGRIVEITSEHEIAEIEEAILQCQNTKLDGVHLHLKSAVVLLSDRKNPNYGKSITESFNALEAMVKIITGEPKKSLGQALGIIDGKIELNGVLVEGYKKLYGYASSESGLRHGGFDVKNIYFEDAKYMLVSCSAFINYLKEKSVKAGIDFA